MSSAQSVTANFNTNSSTPTTLGELVLPTSRTVPVGTMATIFNTVINAGTNSASGITLSMNPVPAGTFVYQQTDCASNAIIGSPNPSLGPGSRRRTVLCALLHTQRNLCCNECAYPCAGWQCPLHYFIDRDQHLALRATDTLGPDIIALTTTTDFHQVSCSGANAFAVCTLECGSGCNRRYYCHSQHRFSNIATNYLDQ